MGCPVIAYKKGGALDTVIDKKTGLFFNEQSIEFLIDAIKMFDGMKFYKKDLIDNAYRFSKNKFKEKIIDIVERNL